MPTWEQRLLAAVLATGLGGAASRRSAAALWRIPGFRPGPVEVTQVRGPSARNPGQGLHDSKVPRVSKALDEITQMNFTPNEGFMLSRINGQWDLGSLIKISPIREPDAMLIFYKLWRDGIIALE